jgi:EthD domain-containing protein
MEKLIYLLWKPDAQSVDLFREELIDRRAPRLLELGALALTINVSDLIDQVGRNSPLVIGEGKTVSASLSLWLDCLDERAPIEAELRAVAPRLAGYLVTESVPMRCPDRDWPDGVRSPGVTLWTAFPKPERVSDEAFYAHWHGSHTPLSFEIHPLWEYVRNAVARPLTAGAPPYRAIVEERFRTLEELIDPMKFFGSAENIQRVLTDIAAFSDLDQMNTAPMSEWIIKSC